MCGLAGFAGIADSSARFRLVLALGAGIDMRGGHAAGYVALAGNTIRYAKKAGEWSDARYRFLLSASRSDICLMHARYATCGEKYAVEQAHPFTIRREGKVVLFGAHNGMIFDAWDSAKWHGREIDVDSQELFELIADGEFDTLKQLEGYGVAMWIEPGTDHVKLARLSDYSEICVVKVKGGGIVWGSTWNIVVDALEEAELEAEAEFQLDEIGRVYQIHQDRVLLSEVTGVKVADSWTSAYKKETVIDFTDDDEKFMAELDEMELKYNNWFKDDRIAKDIPKSWNALREGLDDEEDNDYFGTRFLTKGM